jgi:hypothetical protein
VVALAAASAQPPALSPTALTMPRLVFSLGRRTLWQSALPVEMRYVPLNLAIAGTLPTVPTSIWLRGAPEAGLDALPAGLRLVTQCYQRRWLDLRGGAAAMAARWSSEWRNQLKRKQKKLRAAAPDLVFEAFATAQELQHFFSLARAVSAQSYQERMLGKGFPKEAAALATRDDWASGRGARGYVLHAGGQPISYLYLRIQGDCALYQHLGYHPDWAALSVGTVLHDLAFAHLAEEAVVAFLDFTEGDGQHKRSFASGAVACADVIVVPPSLRMRAMFAAYRLWTGGISLVKQIRTKLVAKD